MSTIYRLDASIRPEGSVTRSLANTLQTELESGLDEFTIIHREIGLTPLPSTAWGNALAAGSTPAEQRTADQNAATALATELADELVAADALVFAVPLYNYGVSAQFKSYADLLLTEPRFAPGAPQALAGRPAFLVTARGGGYGPGTPREGWDHSTPWNVRLLRDIWGLDLELIEAELTLADVSPAMEALRPLAAQNLENAHSAAIAHAQALVASLASAEESAA
ncbi:MAG: putative acyl carrier protein phosphodiesterase [Subtercola sp.]|nr:putative acyl carrier protein phosphodiesterase [Subtercola sp.]